MSRYLDHSLASGATGVQLIAFSSVIEVSMGQKHLCYVDFKKAFDSVNRIVLWTEFWSQSPNSFSLAELVYPSLFFCLRLSGAPSFCVFGTISLQRVLTTDRGR